MLQLMRSGDLRRLIRECLQVFTRHHSSTDRCTHCGIGDSLEEKIDRLEFEHAVRSTLAKELHWISVWQNYEG